MKQTLLTSSIISLSLLFSCNSTTSESSQPENAKKQSAGETVKTENQKNIGFKDEPMDEKTIKTLVGFKDNIEEFLSWSDSEGKHIVFTSESGIYETKSKEEDEDNGLPRYQNAQIVCYHYIQKTGQQNFEKSWKIFDYSRDCPVDAGATFKNNTLQKTDLNKNGIAEIWVMYYTFCKGDVSPSELKIIMYEGDLKYKMTGETKVMIGENESDGGSIKSEGNFKNQPEFLAFAKSLWKNNCSETFGE